MTEPWDHRFLQLAKHISTWSKDPSTQVGAVLVNDLKHVVAMGFNGFATGVHDTSERLNDRPTKYKMVVHAEQNAILQAGERARGCTLYVYPTFCVPTICHECAKFAIQAGVRCVVGYELDPDHPRAAAWKESADLAGQMFLEAGVVWYNIREEQAH